MNELELLSDKPVDHMLQTIKESKQMITKATMNFGKRQSQFMDNMLTLSHPTPYRNLRQILSEIERSQQGLNEAYIKHRRKKLELTHKLKKAYDDEYLADVNAIDIDEIKINLESSEKYICGAIRKIKNYIDQYNSIIERIKEIRGVSELTEKDFEEEEEKYHIKTAFAQALTAARSRGGLIDEGNHIYLYQIGINGADAQECISAFLNREANLIKEGISPAHSMVIGFLEEMYQRHKGCSERYSQFKCMKLNNEEALLIGDKHASD